jgi:atrial natriuretic peptide receptor A
MATTLANVDASIFCGHYKGIKVAVKPINIPKLTITRENLIEFKQMREVMHNNLVKFAGLCIEEPNTAIVSELCVRGSLRGATFVHKRAKNKNRF